MAETKQYELRPVFHLELLEYLVKVKLHGLFANVELVCDVLVSIAVQHELDYLYLGLGKVVYLTLAAFRFTALAMTAKIES